MVQGVYIDRAQSARLTFDKALSRYLSEVVPTKKPATQETDKYCAEPLRAYFGKYSLAAISPDLVAGYRDKRLATPQADESRDRRPGASRHTARRRGSRASAHPRGRAGLNRAVSR